MHVLGDAFGFYQNEGLATIYISYIYRSKISHGDGFPLTYSVIL